MLCCKLAACMQRCVKLCRDRDVRRNDEQFAMALHTRSCGRCRCRGGVFRGCYCEDGASESAQESAQDDSPANRLAQPMRARRNATSSRGVYNKLVIATRVHGQGHQHCNSSELRSQRLQLLSSTPIASQLNHICNRFGQYLCAWLDVM